MVERLIFLAVRVTIWFWMLSALWRGDEGI
jgi:hypothetical protein